MDKISLQRLQSLEPLGRLSAARLTEMLPLCHCVDLPAGSRALPEFDGADLVYLLDGEWVMTAADGGRVLLVGGYDQALRPLPLMRAGRAVTDVTLMCLSRQVVDIMATWAEMACVAETGQVACEDAPAWQWMAGAFPMQQLTQGCLAALPPAHIHALLQRFTRQPAQRGDIIVQEGEEGDFYYLIESGCCEVFRVLGGTEWVVAQLKAGEAFGEEALVSGTRRSASVRMATDGMLLRLGKQEFIELLQRPLLQSIDFAAACREVDQRGACWLDVGYAAEFAEYALPGALNIPLSELRGALPLLDRQKNYIVGCPTGRRSSAAAFLMAQYGYAASCVQDGWPERLRQVAAEEIAS